MLKQYISTGYYINDCDNDLQPPITGIAIYTGFFNQCHADGMAYYLASENASYLRSLSPCIVLPTTTTTTTSTTTVSPQINISASGISYNWSDYFGANSDDYYDVVAWGQTNGYISGVTFGTNRYFSSVVANDMAGDGIVLAIINTSGKVTGFGTNFANQLDIPIALTGVIQVSIGYDHCLALKNDYTVTGWGRDNWGILNFHTGLRNVRKVCAGVGASVFLLDSGIVTGTNTIGGGAYNINYPTETGFLNVDHCSSHILLVKANGALTGLGANSFGESDLTNISGAFRINAGISTSAITYNNGYITGYGTNQAKYNTPYISNSGVDFQLKGHIGTVLKNNKDIEQWCAPWNLESGNITSKPTYIKNNIVAISQGVNFTAAIIKRPQTFSYDITGYNYLWKVSSLGGNNNYGGISVGDLYPPSGLFVQLCDGYSFLLPGISGANQAYTGLDVPNCSSYAGYHDIVFNGVEVSYRILNVNYGKTGYALKTGFAATGITTYDLWNTYLHTDLLDKPLYYSNGLSSTISGGRISMGSGSGLSFTSNDNMYATTFSGISGYRFGIRYTNFETGNYSGYIYAHGPTSTQNSYVNAYLNGNVIVYSSGTVTGNGFNNSPFTGGLHYIPLSFSINNTNDIFMLQISGFINGIQFIKV